MRLKQTLVFCLVFLLSLNKPMAMEEGPRETVPRRDFVSFLIRKEVEAAYTQPKDQILQTIKSVGKKALKLKWELYNQLAQKTGQKIDPLEKLECRFHMSVYEIVETSVVRDGRSVNQKTRKFVVSPGFKETFDKSDVALDLLLERATLEQMRAFLASLHRIIQLDDILLFAANDAPASTWAGCDYAPVQPRESLRYYFTDAMHCYEEVWKSEFPKSSGFIEKYEFIAFVSFAEFSPPWNDGGYLSWAWGLLKGCCRKYGRIKSHDTAFAFAQPMINLYKYACSPLFPAVLNRESERRLEYTPVSRMFREILNPCFLCKKNKIMDCQYVRPHPRTEATKLAMKACDAVTMGVIPSARSLLGLGPRQEELVKCLMASFGEEKAKLTGDLAVEKARTKELDGQVLQMTSEQSSLKDQVKKQKAEIQKLQYLREEERRQHQGSVVAQLEKERDGLIVEVGLQRLEIGRLRGEIDSLNSQLAELNERYEDCTGRVDELEKSLSQARANYEEQVKATRVAQRQAQEQRLLREKLQLEINRLGHQFESKLKELIRAEADQKMRRIYSNTGVQPKREKAERFRQQRELEEKEK